MEFSVVVWPGGRRSRVGSRCRSKVKLGAPPKPNAITLTPSVADIVMQHHRPLQIPITLTICRSVCKCAKVIWQMWKCRNVHLEGGTGGSCPAMQRTNLVGDIWRAKWLQVKLALIQFFSVFDAKILKVWRNFLLFICLQRKQRCERCRPLLRTHSAIEPFSSFYIWQMGRVVFGEGLGRNLMKLLIQRLPRQLLFPSRLN